MVLRVAAAICDLGELPWLILSWALTAGYISALFLFRFPSRIARIVTLGYSL
jgi:hypothetical protein